MKVHRAEVDDEAETRRASDSRHSLKQSCSLYPYLPRKSLFKIAYVSKGCHHSMVVSFSMLAATLEYILEVVKRKLRTLRAIKCRRFHVIL